MTFDEFMIESASGVSGVPEFENGTAVAIVSLRNA